LQLRQHPRFTAAAAAAAVVVVVVMTSVGYRIIADVSPSPVISTTYIV